MQRLLLAALPLMAMTGAAFAQWELDDASDAQGYLYIAHNIDTTDTVEVQLACDELLEGDILLSVFTGEDALKDKGKPASASLSVKVGDLIFEDLLGEAVDVGGEKVIDVYETDNAEIRDLTTELGKGGQMQLGYGDEVFVVTGMNAPETVRQVLKQCR